LEAPNPLRRRINSIDTDGNESVGFHSHCGTEPCGFISVFNRLNRFIKGKVW
jgi:hypothetical protein